MAPRPLVLVLLFLCAVARAETPLPAPLVIGPAPGQQTSARIAVNEDGYFAAWSDDREGWTTGYAARLRADGTPIDTLGIRLDTIPVAVGCSGGRCVVIGRDLSLVVFDRDAHIVATSDLGGEFTRRAEVLFNGRDFLVVWSTSALQVATIDVDGRASSVSRVLENARFEAAALRGSRAVVLYAQDELLKAATLNATGALLQSDVVIAQNVSLNEEFSEPSASISTSADGFVAVWRGLPSRDLFAQRFDANGDWVGDPLRLRENVLDAKIAGDVIYATEGWPDTRLIAISFPSGEARNVMPAMTIEDAAASLAVVTVEAGDVYAVRASTPPTLIARAAAAHANPQIAVGENTMLVAYEVRPEASIEATLIDRRTGTAATLAIAPSGAQPRVAVVGGAYLVTWLDHERLLGRVVRDGVRLSDVIEIATTIFHGSALASTGREFIAAWFEYGSSSLGTARISIDGEILDTSNAGSVHTPVGQPSPALACSRDECLLAWHDMILSDCQHFICKIDERVKAVRILPSLAVVDSIPILISDNLSLGTGAVAAADDGTYAVAWEHLDSVHTWTIASGVSTPAVTREGRHPALVRQGDSWLLLHEPFDAPDMQLGVTRFRTSASGSDFELVPRDAQARRHASAALLGDDVVVAYERTTRNEDAGGVPRVHLEIIEPPKPRTRAVRP